MQLGQFTPDERRTIRAERANHIGKTVTDPVHGLVEDHRARFVGERLQPLATRRPLRRREAVETEAVGRQTCHRQCRSQCAHPRHRFHPDASLVHRSNQAITRVTDQRCSGIADERHIFATIECFNDIVNSLTFVVIMQRHKCGFCPERR